MTLFVVIYQDQISNCLNALIKFFIFFLFQQYYFRELGSKLRLKISSTLCCQYRKHLTAPAPRVILYKRSPYGLLFIEGESSSTAIEYWRHVVMNTAIGISLIVNSFVVTNLNIWYWLKKHTIKSVYLGCDRAFNNLLAQPLLRLLGSHNRLLIC